MWHILILFILLLSPLTTEAAYKVYLKNGSVISGVRSYEKQNGDILLHVGGGSFGVSGNDVIRIEESGTFEQDFTAPGQAVTEKKQEEQPATPPEPGTDKGARIPALQTELETITAELKANEEEDARLAASINEKISRRYNYNQYQMKKLEQEIQPLQQELFSLRESKTRLIQRKSFLEGELRALQ